MSLLIPTRSDLPFYDLQVLLDGTTYTLQFRFNVRLGAWFMDVLDEQAVTYLLASIRLVADWPLASYNTGRPWPGAFVVVDTSSQGLDPGENDLGDRVQLVYFTRAELGI